MSHQVSDRPEFAKLLAEECDRILTDDMFLRAPVQSKLLAFLCKKGVEGDSTINQYMVAVDGLGRKEDYNVDSDSYPRVQISRLRSNLAAYYSRHGSAKSLCVYLRPGEYVLRLASREIAYPDFVKLDEATDQKSQDGSTTAQPVSSVATQQTDSEKAEPKGQAGYYTPAVKLALISIAAAAALLVYFSVNYYPSPAPDAILSEPPTVALDVPQGGYFNQNDENLQLAANIKRLARNQISESFVSNLTILKGPGDTAASYTIKIDLGDGLTNPEASIFLIDQYEMELFQTTVVLRGEKDKFLRQVNAALASILGPSGILAQREVARISGEPRSAYECQLVIENEREKGIDIAQRVADCLQQFPNDNYAASWLAREALGVYFQQIAEGIPPTKQSDGWRLVSRALMIDAYNPYANFLAAKIDIAEGKCEAAQILIERARDRSKSYPTLIAATYAESGGCLGNTDSSEASRQAQRAEISALIDTNPMPSVPLRTNLILASLSLGFPDLVTTAANLPVSYNGDGNDKGLANALALSEDLGRANIDAAYFRDNRRRLETQLKIYVWNNAARQKVIETLEQ